MDGFHSTGDAVGQYGVWARGQNSGTRVPSVLVTIGGWHLSELRDIDAASKG